MCHFEVSKETSETKWLAKKNWLYGQNTKTKEDKEEEREREHTINEEKSKKKNNIESSTYKCNKVNKCAPVLKCICIN